MIMNNLAEYNGSCIDFKNPNNLYQLSDAQKAMKKRYRNEGFKFLILSDYDLAIWHINDYIISILLPMIRIKRIAESFMKHKLLILAVI